MWVLDVKMEADECEFPWAELTWGLIDWKICAYVFRKQIVWSFILCKLQSVCVCVFVAVRRFVL